jgi:hypothetical protein
MHALFTTKGTQIVLTFNYNNFRVSTCAAYHQLVISTHYERKVLEGQTNVASMTRDVQNEMKISIYLKDTMAMVQGNTRQCFPVMSVYSY